jgi:hypothetical protein
MQLELTWRSLVCPDIEALEDPRSERSAGKGTVSTNSQLQIY